MKRCLFAGLMVLMMLMMLGACTGIPGADNIDVDEDALSKTVETLDGKFSIDIPGSWVKDYTYTDEDMIAQNEYLRYTNNEAAFVSIYFYSSADFDYNMNNALSYNLDYFGEGLIGEYEEMSLDGMDVFVLQTSMVDISVDHAEVNYHGFYYMINTPYGVAEIDVYYAQEVFESKIIKPSEEQLLLLQEIAESFEVIE